MSPFIEGGWGETLGLFRLIDLSEGILYFKAGEDEEMPGEFASRVLPQRFLKLTRCRGDQSEFQCDEPLCGFVTCALPY